MRIRADDGSDRGIDLTTVAVPAGGDLAVASEAGASSTSVGPVDGGRDEVGARGGAGLPGPSPMHCHTRDQWHSSTTESSNERPVAAVTGGGLRSIDRRLSSRQLSRGV